MKSIVQSAILSIVLFLVVVVVFWSLSPPGTELTEVLLTWLPTLFIFAIAMAFLSHAARDGEKRKERRDAHMQNVEQQLERIAKALEQLREPRT